MPTPSLKELSLISSTKYLPTPRIRAFTPLPGGNFNLSFARPNLKRQWGWTVSTSTSFQCFPRPYNTGFFFLTRKVMTLDIPQTWLEAETFLLHKGGDPTSPSNYRPIALLTSIYKIIATHTSIFLNAHTSKLGTLSSSQFGFRNKHQTTDHPIVLAAKRTLHPSSYILYLDLSKAFNSVILSTLFKLLEKAGFPPEFIAMIKRLYKHLWTRLG